MTPSDAQVYGPALTLLTVIAGGLVGLYIRRQDRRDAERRQERDDDRYQAEKKERADQAEIIRREVERRALELAETLRLRAALQELADEKAHDETLSRIAATHATAREAVDGAQQAFHEANSVNVKILDTNKAIAGIQTQLEATLAKLPAPRSAESLSSTDTITGTFSGRVDPP